MKTKKYRVPPEILAAVVCLLTPYHPHVSAKGLCDALDALGREAEEEPEPTNFLTVTEVCKILHRSRASLWRDAREGRIKTVKLGRRVLFPEAEIKRIAKMVS